MPPIGSAADDVMADEAKREVVESELPQQGAAAAAASQDSQTASSSGAIGFVFRNSDL